MVEWREDKPENRRERRSMSHTWRRSNTGSFTSHECSKDTSLPAQHFPSSYPARRSLLSLLSPVMAIASTSDVIVLSVGFVLAAVYLFREQIFDSGKSKSSVPVSSKSTANGSGNPRDFVAKMKAGVSIPSSGLPWTHGWLVRKYDMSRSHVLGAPSVARLRRPRFGADGVARLYCITPFDASVLYPVSTRYPRTRLRFRRRRVVASAEDACFHSSECSFRRRSD